MKQAEQAAVLAIAALAVLARSSLLVCPERGCPVPALDAAGLVAAKAWRAAWLLRPGHRLMSAEALAGSLLVAAVALCRVYLQVHFPSDVVVGMVAALLWVMALRGLPFWQQANQPGAAPGAGETR